MTILENLNKPEHIDRYIRELTMYLWRKCYQQDGVKFELMDDTYNVLAQLDNMLTGVVRKPAPVEQEEDGDQEIVGPFFTVKELIAGIDAHQPAHVHEWKPALGMGQNVKICACGWAHWE